MPSGDKDGNYLDGDSVRIKIRRKITSRGVPLPEKMKKTNTKSKSKTKTK